MQTHGSAVLNRKYSAHPIFVQFVDLPIRDHSATTAKNVNMCCASLLQQINHILRSEERRVGKECRFRWLPYNLKKSEQKYITSHTIIIFYWTLFFFFQAEDGIRDGHVTGVQTCALPILVLPSSTENILLTPYSCSSSISRSEITPPPPPKM